MQILQFLDPVENIGPIKCFTAIPSRHCALHYAARTMGGVTLRQKKREELESKSSHKSDIWPPAASKK